jgi:hypothetical protein
MPTRTDDMNADKDIEQHIGEIAANLIENGKIIDEIILEAIEIEKTSRQHERDN